MAKPMSVEMIQVAIDLVEKHGSIAAAARAAGMSSSTLSDRYARRGELDPNSEQAKARNQYERCKKDTAAEDAQKRVDAVAIAEADKLAKSAIGEVVDIDENVASGKLNLYILSKDARIQKPEEALKKAGIDMDIWEIEKLHIRSYEMGCKVEIPNDKGHKVMRGVAVTPMFSISINLKRIVDEDEFKAFRSLVEEMKATPIRAAKITRPVRHDEDKFLFEISLADQHFGKLAWKPEVLENFDLEIAEARYLSAMNDLLYGIKPFNVEEILMIVGNDHFHVNNADLTTARGTAQDVDGRWQKVFTVGKMATIRAIEMARTVAPVNVMIIAGNHDPEWCYFLGEVLTERYRNVKDITVDNRPVFRKYKQYGKTLLGFTHGDKEKLDSLPLTMAREMPQAWADSTYHEFHLGHLHKRTEYKYTAGDTFNGVTVRRLPSLTGTDSWHHTHGYSGGHKSSDAYLWHNRKGLHRVFVVNAEDEDAHSPDASQTGASGDL